MAITVLVPTEGSPLSNRALEVALHDYPDATVIVLHVMDPIGSGLSVFDVLRPKLRDGAPPGSVTLEYWQEWRTGAEEKAAEVFETSRSIADEVDRPIDTVLDFGDPAAVIMEYAEDNEVDRIIMGSHCREGADRFLIGSVAETVVRRSPVPVMIVR